MRCKLTAMATTALAATSLAGAIGAASLAQSRVQEVNVYSGRHYNTDKLLYREFTRRTGIKVNLLEGKDDELIQRLKSEGAKSKADLLVLVDAARIYRAQQDNLFQSISSPELNKDVPANLRDPGGRWYALTRRARPVMVNPAQVNPKGIRTTADLAKPELKGKLCLRNRASVYNQSLVADQLILRGNQATSTWLKGLTANVKQAYFSSDTPLIRAVARGECGVALVNTYYVARMLNGESGAADRALASQLKVIFPKPAHVNITGAGVTRYAKNPEAALKLIEFLASPTGGRGYAEANNEYPLKGYGDNATLKRFGPFKADGVSAQQLGAKISAAIKLMDVSGWK